MPRVRYTTEQIINKLRQAAMGFTYGELRGVLRTPAPAERVD